jgi:hypothetical protein
MRPPPMRRQRLLTMMITSWTLALKLLSATEMTPTTKPWEKKRLQKGVQGFGNICCNIFIYMLVVDKEG